MGLRLVRSNGANAVHGFMPVWYAQWREDGKLRERPLFAKSKDEDGNEIAKPVPVCGKPPASGSMKEKGDAAFERSRARAKAALEAFLASKKKISKKEELLKREQELEINSAMRIHRAKFADIDKKFPPLSELGQRVIESLDGEPRWMNYVKSIFDDFAEYAAADQRFDLLSISTDFARRYMKHLINEEKYSWETVKKHIHRLSSAFAERLPGGNNPFKDLIKREGATNHKINTEPTKRRPLSNIELSAMFVEARKMGEDIYNITACAANTGMRIKDVCLLKWADILFDKGLIKCTTAKTGARVTIPIMNELADVLDGLATDVNGKRSIYVFPEMAAKYLSNPTGIIRTGKVLFARTLAALDNTPEDAESVNAPELLDEEKDEAIMAAIEAANWKESKRERIRLCYSLFRDGLSYYDIEEKTGILHGQVSAYFGEVERIAGLTFRKGVKNGFTGVSEQAMIEKYTREHGKQGKSNLSIYSWHSLRHTFVVRALNRRVLNASIQRIVGHTTFNQTMEYYNPTDEIAAVDMRMKMDERFAKNPASAQMSAMLQAFAAMPPEDRITFMSMMNQPVALNK